MGSKKRSIQSVTLHVTEEPVNFQAVLNRESPITPPQKLAVCYMNRPHDSLAGVPYAVWQELCAWMWVSPSGVGCTCPSMIGLKAPDAVPLPIVHYLREIDGNGQSETSKEEERIVWVYPKL